MGRWRCLKRADVAKAQIPVWGVAAVPETGTARTSVAGRCVKRRKHCPNVNTLAGAGRLFCTLRFRARSVFTD
nr:hypothetical protein Iba_scaffold9175CG0200 [Ipomoea batatas]